MRIALSLGVALVAAGALAHATVKDSDPIALSMSWHVSIDAQGHVTQLQAKPDKRVDRVAQVRDAVEKKIRTWQFVPGAIDGVPQATETSLSVATTLLPRSGDSYEIRIDDARTGADIAKTLPPRYPHEAVQHGASGLVVLRIEFDADGRVTSAAPNKSETKAPGSMVKASLDAVKKWTFQPERVGGHGVAGTTELPMCFFVVPSGTPVANLPGCAWIPPGHRGALAQGESIGINPVARLAADVVDHTL